MPSGMQPCGSLEETRCVRRAPALLRGKCVRAPDRGMGAGTAKPAGNTCQLPCDPQPQAERQRLDPAAAPQLLARCGRAAHELTVPPPSDGCVHRLPTMTGSWHAGWRAADERRAVPM